MSKKDWDITNKPHTKNKLDIIREIFDIWLTIWGGTRQQKWVAKEWYVIDLFAGIGSYHDKGKEISGSSLIFLEEILKKEKKLKKNGIKVKLFLIEIKPKNFDELKKRVENFLSVDKSVKNIVEVSYYRNDCNRSIDEILSLITDSLKSPLFILIDPSGLQIKKETIKKIADLQNPKDILLNYILEGVRRAGGVYKKSKLNKDLNQTEIKTINTLKEFLGDDVKIIDKNDKEVLEQYVSILTKKGLNIIGYDMPYPDRNDILYYLLFASKKPKIAEIIRKIYHHRKKKQDPQISLFGEEYEKNNIFSSKSKSKVISIRRKSLLYKTKVEYGDWTINHVVGCMHGCNFPCYAMRMAQKFGWVRDYEDWRRPRIAINALELLDKEIPKYKSQIKFVHLCFMSDPFMYDSETGNLVPEIKQLTLQIIKRLNKEGIKVTTLTKGIYPVEELINQKPLPANEYGITLVSLNSEFKKRFEPFSSSYDSRVEALKKLAKIGLKTWVSMEPYPIPQYDSEAGNVSRILNKIRFVNKIIFGKFNYRRLIMNNGNSSAWSNSDEFYENIAKKVINFCQKNDIEYHIKFGTPLSTNKTTEIF